MFRGVCHCLSLRNDPGVPWTSSIQILVIGDLAQLLRSDRIRLASGGDKMHTILLCLVSLQTEKALMISQRITMIVEHISGNPLTTVVTVSLS